MGLFVYYTSKVSVIKSLIIAVYNCIAFKCMRLTKDDATWTGLLVRVKFWMWCDGSAVSYVWSCCILHNQGSFCPWFQSIYFKLTMVAIRNLFYTFTASEIYSNFFAHHLKQALKKTIFEFCCSGSASIALALCTHNLYYSMAHLGQEVDSR